MTPLAPSANVGFRESQVHIGVYPGGLTIVLGGQGGKVRQGEIGRGLRTFLFDVPNCCH